jgi:hypothetical protein
MAGGRSADMQQAAYFHDLLSQHRAEICENLDEHRAALAHDERRGDVSGARHKRRIIKALETEIRTIDRMLRALVVHLDMPTRRPRPDLRR